jgi:tRNA nucleotidyltransferase (CCA-adding enzyme)
MGQTDGVGHTLLYNEPMTTANKLHAKLRAALSPAQFRILEVATGEAARLGLNLYLVGGAVRDLIINARINDLDLVSEGDSFPLAENMASALSGRVTAQSQFGTSKLSARGMNTDLVSARGETYQSPGALPSVFPGTIEDDLARRDFSINAIALRLSPGAPEILDPAQGQTDLESRLIRVLHQESFRDDATRILRAVRYEQRLGFRLEADTEALLQRDLSMLDTISGHRLRRELDLIFSEERPAAVLVRAAELGVLAAISPSLPDAATLRERLSHMDASAPAVHYLGVLVYSLETDQIESFVRRLSMTAPWARMVHQVAPARKAASDLTEGSSPSVVSTLLRALDTDAVAVVAALTRSQPFQRFLQEWRYVRPMLTGRDLVQLGVPEGPQLGSILELLRDAKLDGRTGTREEEVDFVQKYAKIS